MRDVSQWLEGLGLGEYAGAFAENRIDVDVLPSLTSNDLKDIGVVAVGDRRKLLDAITALSELQEALAHQVDDFTRRHCGVASACARWFSV